MPSLLMLEVTGEFVARLSASFDAMFFSVGGVLFVGLLLRFLESTDILSEVDTLLFSQGDCTLLHSSFAIFNSDFNLSSVGFIFWVI